MKNKLIHFLAIASTAMVGGIGFSQTAPAANPPATIVIDATAPRVTVSPELYGIFFEEINHAGDGGLYAELIQNRNFEGATVPDGWKVDGDSVSTPLGWKTPKWFQDDIPGWSYVADGGGEGSIKLDSSTPLNPQNPLSLEITVDKVGDRCGVANSGYWGMNIQKGEWYDATFYARTENNKRVGLLFSLESADGKTICARTTLPEIGSTPWRKYILSLHAYNTDPKARLVITPIESGTPIWLNMVSLFPRKTFKDRPNGLRPELAQMLADLHPGFLRFPGGCVVEGATMDDRIKWQDSVGDISQRKGAFDMWGYYASMGLGFQEYLQLAEDIGAEPVYVINSGIACQFRPASETETAADADLGPYVQESMNALEYAMGPVTSQFGAMRAANGHPDPFRIKYVEIGNENKGTAYDSHYKVFYDAIKAKYPRIITIADARMKQNPMEFVDDHFYSTPARFFSMANQYDKADRAGPKIYVGEYAVNSGVGKGNLQGALAEGVFMLNMEKNSDVVKMCSYAPLFENVNDSRWPVNLIRYDSSRVVGRTSYYMQKLFSANRPDVSLSTQVQADEVGLVPPGGESSAKSAQIKQLYALAGLDQQHGELVLKVINPTSAPVQATISLKGLSKIGGQAKVTMLGSADAGAENTLDNPNVVVPVESNVNLANGDLSQSFAANSLTIVRVAATAE